MKYKLINKNTKEETICEKILIDGFDYYVNNNSILKLNDFVYLDNSIKELPDYKGKHIIQLLDKTILDSANVLNTPKTIATNNPNIDIPKVIDEVEELTKNYLNSLATDSPCLKKGFKNGYKQSQQTHPFSESDMEEFILWKEQNRWFNFSNGKWNYTFEQGTSISNDSYEKNYRKTTKELLNLWKEQQIKTIYYN